MEIKIKDLLEKEFKLDPVRKEINILHLEDALYTDNVLSMHPDTTYSTVEAGKIIGRHDSTIRNYFRTELIGYIAPERSGKFYRLDYISVFKLHMILLLVDKANKATADISYLIGISPLVSTVEIRRGTFQSGSDLITDQNALIDGHMSNEISELKKLVTIQNMRSTATMEHSKLLELQHKLLRCQNTLDSLQKSQEILKVKKQNLMLEGKYYKVLDFSLRKSIKNEHQKWGFMDLFRGNKKDSEAIDIDQIIADAILDANDYESTSTRELDEEIQNLQQCYELEEKTKRNLELLLKEQELSYRKVEDQIVLIEEREREGS